MRVDVVPKKLGQGAGNVASVAAVGEVLDQQVLDPSEFLDHGRHQQVEGRRADAGQGQQGAEDGDDPALELQAVLEEGYQRVDQVGDEPGDEEGQEHSAQPFDEDERSDDDAADDDTADKAVEGDFLAFHSVRRIWGLVCCMLVFLDGLQVARAAQGFVLGRFAQQDLLVVLHRAVREGGQLSAFHADGMYLGHFVGNGAQAWHRAEGCAAEVHVEPCDDDAYAIVGQLVAYVNQSVVEKLGFVDAHHVDFRREEQDAGRRVDGSGRNGVAVVRHHFGLRIARVDGRLEDFDPLAGEFGALQPSDEFLCLARKHGAADDFNPPPPPGFLYVVFRKYVHA